MQVVEIFNLHSLIGYTTECFCRLPIKEYFAINLKSPDPIADKRISLFNYSNQLDPYYSDTSRVFMDGGNSYLSMVAENRSEVFLIYFMKIYYSAPSGEVTNSIISSLDINTTDANGTQQITPIFLNQYANEFQHQRKMLIADIRSSPIMLEGSTTIDFILPFVQPSGAMPEPLTMKIVMYYRQMKRQQMNLIYNLTDISKDYINKDCKLN